MRAETQRILGLWRLQDRDAAIAEGRLSTTRATTRTSIGLRLKMPDHDPALPEIGDDD